MNFCKKIGNEDVEYRSCNEYFPVYKKFHTQRDQTLGLMRQTCWFPDMGAGGQGQGVCRDLLAMPSTTAQDRDRAYQVDPIFGGSVAGATLRLQGADQGSWYLHLLNDQYGKFPVVTVHQATSCKLLKPALEETFPCHGIPEVVTSDRGHPYGGRKMEE